MHRLLTCLLAIMILPLGGCFNKRFPEEKPFTQQRWQEMRYEDQQRLLPEEQRDQSAVEGVVQNISTTFVGGVVDFYNYILGRTPFDAAKNLLDPASADRRRKAVFYLADRGYGRQEPYTVYYQEMARTDMHATVRAAAIRALNRARDEQSIPLFIQALQDGNDRVRLEAAKALANMPDPAAQEPLIRRLVDAEEAIDVRIAAADALRHYRNAQTAQALVRVLRDRSFGVSWQARQSLLLMTGQDFRYDPAAWLTYLAGTESPFG
jgi:hypothetical protein